MTGRQAATSADAERTELRNTLRDLARQIAQVGDLTRRNMEK